MKKLIIICTLLLSSLSAYAEERYNLLNPPKVVEFNEPQAKYFFNVAGGCVYLYTMQYKHAAVANLIDGSQPSADWMSNASAESNAWINLAKLTEVILIKNYDATAQEILDYKLGQFAQMNEYFASTFMSTHPQEFFTKLLSSTSYCVLNREPIMKFLQLASEHESNKPKDVPEVDKPVKRM